MLASLPFQVTEYFPNCSKSCVKNFCLIVVSLLVKQTTNLNKLKDHITILVGENSNTDDAAYKRLTRFFNDFGCSSVWTMILHAGFQLLRLESRHLLLDGTSWKRGNRWLNYLTLCVVYKGVAIPIYWMNLGRKGISNFKQRKKLMKKALKLYSLTGKTLLADREFIGIDWFKYLIKKKIEFVIRLKFNTYTQYINAAPGMSYEQMCQKVLKSLVPSKALVKAFEMEGMQLFFVVIKNPNPTADERLIFLISSLNCPAKELANLYPIRWKIEHCFKHMKSNGFHIEDINLRGNAKCNLMMATVVFAYVCVIHLGLKTYKKVSIVRYKDGLGSKRKSVFRHGLSKIMVVCSQWRTFSKFLYRELKRANKIQISPKSIFVQ